MEKKLGKITSAVLGKCGYDNAGFGVSFVLEGSGFGCCHDLWFWDTDMSARGTKWTENERQLKFGEIMTKISKLMRSAKVHDFDRLVGKPVEIIFEENRLKSWRILEEVL